MIKRLTSVAVAVALLAPLLRAEPATMPTPGPTTTPTTVPAALPVNTAVVPVPKLERDSYDWEARHARVLEVQKTIRPEVVMIGDSITHFWAGEPSDVRPRGPVAWKKLFGDRPVLNMGFGWDRTQNVLWRLDHGEFEGVTPKYVVLHIGTNNFTGTKNARANTPAEVADGIAEICRRVRKSSPESKLILMAVMPRGERPTDPYRAKIAELNKRLATYAETNHLTFIDIGPKLMSPDGTLSREMMNDFVHPTEKGYEVWADALRPILDEKRGQP